MKIKTGQAVNAYQVLSKLASMELPFGAAVKIARGLTELEPIVKTFSESREKELKKYGKKDDKGELIKNEAGMVDLINPEAFNKKVDSMVQTEVTVNIEPIKEVELKSVKISAAEVLGIEFMIK